MRTRLSPPARSSLSALVLALVLACVSPLAFAGPGAHGPNGEHLDAPATTQAVSVLPRVEAHTEAFELVAELRASELAIVVDRYQSNEPVLSAQLEVESGALKAVASFRADQGDYVVTDANLLKTLAAPGEHNLVFTLVAGKESDLLDGTLVNTAGRSPAAATADHGHGHGAGDHTHLMGNVMGHAMDRAVWIAGAVAALGLLGGTVWWRKRRRTAHKSRGAL